MHDAKGDHTCFDYFPGTESCPPGTSACVVKPKATFGALGGAPGNGKCSGCFGKSSGPCMHDAAPVCHEYMANSKTCPPGTTLCGPVNCEVSEWSKWSKCSAQCGGGSQSRSRSITVEPKNGGAACPALEDDQDCNTQACVPICNDCVGKSAGPCQHDKDNTCFSYMKGSASICPPGSHACVHQDCVVSEWGKWSKCDATCDGGNQFRSRTVLVEPTSGGKQCPSLQDSQACNTHSCANCAGCLGKSVGPCMQDNVPVCHDYYFGTTECPSGTHECKATAKSFAVQGGSPGNGMCDECFGKSAGPCRHNADSSCHGFTPGTTDCPSGTTACGPVNCEVSEWTAWSKCSASCGGGVQSRSRSITVHPSNGGAKCPTLDDEQACNTDACVPLCQDCVLGTYGPCQHDKDNSCFGYFTKGGLNECPPGSHECVVQDCEVSAWSKWGKCSAGCGGGSQSRSRTVLVQPSPGGLECPDLSEDQACNTHDCSDCTGCAGKSSGPCMQDNNNVCHGYYYGTSNCPAGTTECKTKVKGTFLALGDAAGDAGDGMCTGCFGKSAGPCRHLKDTSCFSYVAGTTSCPAGTAPCAPTNCEVSEWSAWSKCSVTCGGGSQSRSRSVTVEPTNGGMKCPHLEEDQSCNAHKCPVLCDHCGGKSAGPCRHDKDGTCHHYQTGTTCPAGTTECENVDCEVSQWTEWSKCSASCGGGSSSRTRKIIQEPSKFGQQCPTLAESQDCNTHKCAGCAGCAGKSSGPCMQNNNNVCHEYYEGTSTCPAGTTKCTGLKSLALQGGSPGDGMCTGCFGKSAGPCRHVKDTSCYAFMYGTTTCPPGTAPCAPINCEVSEWSAWSKCSAACGGGAQGRSRSITVAPSNGGAACPSLEENQSCNNHACPPACTDCYKKSSGPCRHDNDGSCHQFIEGTTACPAGTTQCEDVDCVVSEWGAWGKCSAKCDGGLQARARSVLTQPKGNGAACPDLNEARDCNTHQCNSCSGCVGGTSGPCQHDKDNTCFGYFPGTKACFPGTTACVVKGTSLGLLGGSPGDGMCTGCFGKSAGPCRHVKDTSCYAFMYGTTTCPPGTAPCAPTNCEVSEWSAWSKCSAACGGGERSRTRTVTVQPSNGGMKCPALEEVDVHCNEHACPSVCTGCVGGTSGNCRHDKDGTCFEFFTKGGLQECVPGTTECAPVDCEVSAWSKWGKCSALCGGGSQTRTRAVTVEPRDGGVACPALSDSQDCNTHKCTDCVGCAAKTSGPCQHDKANVCYDYYPDTTTCPSGTHDCSSKTLGTFGLLGGKAGSPGDGMCRDCFGKSAGPCRHNKDSSCFAFVDGTTDCPAGTHQCAIVNCEVSEWGAWGKCSADCDGGSQTRSRKVTVTPTNGGMKCPSLTDEQDCNTHACEPVCTACVGKSAGPCQQIKDGTCHAYMKGTKATCPPGTIECAVPVDCEVSEWSKWDTCSEKCGGGEQSRTRSITVAAANGGNACPALSETQACNTQKCDACSACNGKSSGPCQNPANGVCYDYYYKTTLCPAGTVSCVNKKLNLASVDLLGTPKGDGMCGGCFGKSAGPCRHLKDTSCFAYMHGTTTCPPGTAPCAPTNCEVSKWSAWSKCSAACGGGSQSRSRTVTVAPSNGGDACPELSESQACNTHNCPVRCDECGGKSAGPCRHDKDGTCHEYQTGTTCPAGTTECEEVNCEVSEWGAWGKCDATCGGGQQQRSRSVTVEPTNGGKQCPHLTEAQSCNTHSCKGCTGCLGKSEGTCMHNKVNVCYGYYAGTTICPAGTTACAAKPLGTFALLGGSPGDGMCDGCFGKSEGPCKNTADNVCHSFMKGSLTCPPGTSACSPSNCVVSKWSAWSKCSASCGGGSQSRSRSVLSQPTNGGTKCPALSESQDCNTHKCGAKKIDAPMCGKCAGVSSGPCRHTKDNVCHDYYFGTTICPSGTSACVLCEKCDGKTSGPCQHDADGSCHAYQIGTTCPAGTHDCSQKDSGSGSGSGSDTGSGTGSGSGSGSGSGQCTGCWPGTAGPCQQKNTVCHAYFPGTESCPGGTYECKKSGSFPAKPLVVFDIAVTGNVDEDAFEAELASAIGTDAGSVVVEVLSSNDNGGSNVGFVVVSDDPLATSVAVSTALETNQLSAGFAGMNKPAEMSVGGAAVSAPAGTVFSTMAIALIAVAGVAVVAVVAAVILRSRRSGSLSRTTSQVTRINIPSPHGVASKKYQNNDDGYSSGEEDAVAPRRKRRGHD